MDAGMAIQSNSQREAEKTISVDDQVQCRNKIDRLPHEVFLDIVCRLHITSLVQFRLVSRAWNKKLSHDPELLNLQLSHAVKNDPCLIFHSRNQLYFVDLSDPENNEQVRELTLPFLPTLTGCHVLSSCNGLLCISSSFLFDTLYICNPFTGNYKELPKSIAFEEQQLTVGFGFHPSSKEYKVVKIVYYSDPQFRNVTIRSLTQIQSDVQILDLSSSKWRSIGKVPYLLDVSSTGVLVNGRLHWVTVWGRYHGERDKIIVSFDLCDEGFQEIPRSDDFRDSVIRYSCNYSISVLGGCLSAGLSDSLNYIILQLWVMKEYNVKESWECVCTIGANLPMHDLQDPTMAGYFMWLYDQACQSAYSALCRLKNGEILLDTQEALVLYNPKSKETRNLMFKGMPNDFISIVVHVGSLSWID